MNYIEDYIQQELVLTNLENDSEKVQKEILDKIDPNNFEDMIYVSDFYLSKGQFRNQFLDKISQITTWRTYLDQQPPMDFIMVFLKDMKMDLTDMSLVNYYLTHFKVPIPVFKNYFEKIYKFVLAMNENDRIKLRKDSTIYDGIFALQTKYELIEILDYLIRNVERDGLNSSYSDVLMILLEFLKLREDIAIPQNRLERLSNLIQ
jgi:hypothetical protein